MKKIVVIIFGLLIFGFAPHFLHAATVSTTELEAEVTKFRRSVPEFEAIAREAERRGLRVYILGGAAASLAEHAKLYVLDRQGLLRSHSTGTPVHHSRLDWNFHNLLLPEQDVDLVITKANGAPESVAEINAFRDWVRGAYPYESDGRPRWDVLGLKTSDPQGHKMALKGNPDFLNQNNDSLSLGMIELTKPPKGESVISDLGPKGAFLRDTAGDVVHFYRNPLHSQTAYYLSGRNPEILSAIRTLEKATRYEKEVDTKGAEAIKKIIQVWDPQSVQSNSYVENYVNGRAKRIVTHAQNLHQAFDILDATGLRDKLMQVSLGDVSEKDSLAWWMNKQPLPLHSKGQFSGSATGRTAADLGIQYVTHWTNFPNHRLMTWNHDGKPRLFLSRSNVDGERAVLGEGFYTYKNSEMNSTYNPASSDAVVHFTVNPKAREGIDFDVHDNNVVVWKNSSALKVEHYDTPYPSQMTCGSFYAGLGQRTNRNQFASQYVASRVGGGPASGTTRAASQAPHPSQYSNPNSPHYAPGTINNPGAGAGMGVPGTPSWTGGVPFGNSLNFTSSPYNALNQMLQNPNISQKFRMELLALESAAFQRGTPVTLGELSSALARQYKSGVIWSTDAALVNNLIKNDLATSALVDVTVKAMERLKLYKEANHLKANPFFIFDSSTLDIIKNNLAKRSWLDRTSLSARIAAKEFSEKHPWTTILLTTGGVIFGVDQLNSWVTDKNKSTSQPQVVTTTSTNTSTDPLTNP